MANEEHLKILREGIEVWNKWRIEHPDIQPDLIEVDLSGADLSGANLSGADLSWVDLRETNLSWAILSGANLSGADLSWATLRQTNLSWATLRETDLSWVDLRETNLSWADLIGADLSGADLSGADLSGADLSEADLVGANFSRANLSRATFREADLSRATFREAPLSRANLNRANLSGADLIEADLSGAILIEADLSRANLLETVFGNTDLTDAKGLVTCRHVGPSILDHRTLAKSGPLPLEFLHGCGLTDWEIESAKLYDPNLSRANIADIVTKVHRLRSDTPIQIHNLYISYSHADAAFVEHLEQSLRARHIRFWRDVHDAPADSLEAIVVRAMRQNPSVLLIFSEHSVKSDWVEFEIQQARKLEKELGGPVLCPIALDESWKKCPWSKVLMKQVRKYNILNFSQWQNDANFARMFGRLVEGLDLYYFSFR